MLPGDFAGYVVVAMALGFWAAFAEAVFKRSTRERDEIFREAAEREGK